MRTTSGNWQKWMRSAAAVVLLGSGSAGAQSTRPEAAGADAPRVSSPYWNGGGGAERSAAATDFLSQATLAVPAARATAVEARWRYFAADRAFSQRHRDMTLSFEASDPYRSASAELSAAWDAFESARNKALASLHESGSYRASMELSERVGEQIAAEAAKPEPDTAQIESLARLRLDYLRVSRIREADTLRGNSEVAAARRRLQEAGRRLTMLRDDFAREVRQSIELADLRRSKDEARIRRLATEAFLDSALEARAIAIDYAVYSRAIDRFTPANGYSYSYGYGNGYGGYPGYYAPIRVR